MDGRRHDQTVRITIPIAFRASRVPTIGTVVKHWKVVAHGKAGYNQCRCVRCEHLQDVRLDDASTFSGREQCAVYVARCQQCGMSTSGEQLAVRRPRYVTGR